MFSHLKARWSELKHFAPGERFESFYQAQQHRARWVHLAYIAAAVVLIPVGVVFAFIPGPAVLFFALSAALFATQSLWLARKLDRAELALRKGWLDFRAWWRSRRNRHA